jgi:hypothetical protein
MSAPAAASARVRIFLSYSSHDTALARRLRTHVEGHGVRCFFAPASIKELEDWRDRLKTEIGQSHLLLLLHTTSASESPHVQDEVAEAERVGCEIWELRVTGTEVSRFFHGRPFAWKQAFSLSPDDEPACLQAVVDKIDQVWPERRRELGGVETQKSPYPGARPFPAHEFDEAFFGHAPAIHELRRAITGATPLVLVHGPSGAGKTSLLTAGLRRALPAEYAYSLPINGTTAHELLGQALERVRAAPDASAGVAASELVPALQAAMEQGRANHYVLCFDQMESFFAGSVPKREIDGFLEQVNTLLRWRSKGLTVLIAFRKEALADVNRLLRASALRNRLGAEVEVFKLSIAEAEQCIIAPAASRNVTFDDELAEALLAALANDDGYGVPYVNPMDIQKVCGQLWTRVASLEDGRPHWLLDAAVLARVCATGGSLAEDARSFVTEVLREFLRTTIGQIAENESIPIDTKGEQRQEYVKLCLAMVFVGPNRERLRVGERTVDGRRFVGKLPLEAVQALINGGLVQSCGTRQYELVHDSLADEIAKLGGESKSVYAVRRLASEVERRNLGFNQQTELLAELEAVRANRWVFEAAEADFVVRSALGDRRTRGGAEAGAKVDVEAWVRILGEHAPEQLVIALTDALATSEPEVQLDVMTLLQKADVRRFVTDLGPLGARLQDLALSEGEGKVREEACATLVALDEGPRIAALFDRARDPDTRRRGRMAVALTRHAVDTLRGSGRAFWSQWKTLDRWRRLGVLRTLCGWRLKRAYGWMLYISILLAAPLTGVGAVIPFIVLSPWGASLTMENRSISTGIFQGATGGIIWGATVSLGVLLHAVIWRGGRVRNRAREAVAMALSGMTGAAIGGMANGAVIAFVLFPQGLYNSGWLSRLGKLKFWDRLVQVMIETKYGWAMPIFGAALGLGVGWALSAIIGDPRERWKTDRPFESAAAAWQAVKTITSRVMRESWRVALCLAVAAAVIAGLIEPGPGFCNAAYHGGVLPSHCPASDVLPPAWVRVAGLGLIIYGGCVGQLIAFLFGLLSIQFGMDLWKNLPVNSYFMRTAARGERSDMPAV